jgi:hypothetical protein
MTKSLAQSCGVEKSTALAFVSGRTKRIRLRTHLKAIKLRRQVSRVNPDVLRDLLGMTCKFVTRKAAPRSSNRRPADEAPFSRRNVGKQIIDLQAGLPDHTVAIRSKGRGSVIEVAASDLPIRPVIHFQIELSSVLVL